MRPDDELSRTLQRLEAEASIDHEAIDRVFTRVDRERRSAMSSTRGSFFGRLRVPIPARLVAQPIALVVAVALAAGLVVGGAVVAGLFRTPSTTPNPSAVSVAPAARYALSGRPYAMAFRDGALWVASGDGVDRMNIAQGDAAIQRISIGPGRASVGAGGAGIWAASTDANIVVEIDPATNTIARSIPIDAPEFVAVDNRSVWIASTMSGKVFRIDPITEDVIEILVGNAPSQPTLALGSVWVPHDCIMGTPDLGAGAITKIDPNSNQIIGAVAGDGFGCVRAAIVSRSNIWFTDANDGTISEVDPRTDEILRSAEVGERPGGIAELDGELWIPVNPSSSHAGLVGVDPVTLAAASILDLGYDPERSTSGLSQILQVAGSLWVTADFAGRPEVLRIDPPN
jgi:streptogramin lyase